jgi:tetratricopeptide (TPR) repeat protein
MAKQEYGMLRGEFTLDLHHVQTKEAARIVRVRIAECFKHGIRSLKCVFGSPDCLSGSIAEAVLNIAFIDERIFSETLAEWVFADEIDVPSMPIFLVLPIKPNPDALALTPESVFSGFTAAFEPKASLRLLCKMPFQPLREYFDLPYAARAIGGGCKENLLREYCEASGLTVNERGLNQAGLLKCSDSFGHWNKSRANRVRPITTETPNDGHTEESLPFYSHTQPRTVEALFQQAERQLSDVEIFECRETLEVVFALVETDSHRMRYELLLGRILQSEGSAECERHLRMADRLCAALKGTSSPQRIPILRTLAGWYAHNGEVSELIALSEANEAIDVSLPTRIPIRRRFVSDFNYARLLRQAGMFQESVFVLRQFVWHGLMEKAGEMPEVFGPTIDQLLESKVSRVQLAELNLLYAMNCTDDGDGDLELATVFLNLSHRLLVDIANQELLRAEIEQERGRIDRKRGQIDRALRHYDVAIKFAKDSQIVDSYRNFELYLNRGVARVQKGDLKAAAADYERSWSLAESLRLTNQVVVCPLLLSRATLALRNREYAACARLAEEAADLLTLKAAQRHKDIGLARFRQGAALCHLEAYRHGLEVLKDAQREFVLAGTFGVHREQLEMYISLADAQLSVI